MAIDFLLGIVFTHLVSVFSEFGVDLFFPIGESTIISSCYILTDMFSLISTTIVSTVIDPNNINILGGLIMFRGIAANLYLVLYFSTFLFNQN